MDKSSDSAAAAALTQEEVSRWRARTFAMNHDAIIITNRDGHILDWNPAAERIFGYSRAEMLERATSLLHLPEDAATLSNRIRAGIERDGFWSGEIRFVRKDGSTGVCETRVSPLLAEDGQVIGAFGVNRDITERKRLEADRERALERERAARAEAEAARARLRAVLDVLPVGVAITDARGKVLSFNPAFYAIWGETAPLPGEIADYRAYTGWWTDTGEPLAAEDWTMARALLTGEEIRDDEVDIETFSGERKTILNSAAPIRDSAGVMIGGVLAELDITARKRAEDALACAAQVAEERARELETLLETIPDAVSVFDATGKGIFVNEAYRQLLALDANARTFALPPAERAAIFSIRDEAGRLLPHDELPVTRILRGETLTGSRALVARLRTLDGHDVLASTTCAPIHGPNGEATGGIIVMRDVTEQREFEVEAQARAAELEGIFEAMTAAVIFFDVEGRIVRLNRAARELYARAATPDYYARAFPDRAANVALRDEDGDPLPPERWPAARILRGETILSSAGADVQFQTHDGETLNLSLDGVPLRDAGGRITGGITIYQDVTERRQLEHRMHEALDALLAMAQALVALPDSVSPEARVAALHDAERAASDPTALPTALASLAGDQDHETADTATSDASDRHAREHAAVERAVAHRLAVLTCGVLGCTRVGIVAVERETERLRAVAVVGLAPDEEARWWVEQREIEAKGARLGDGANPDELARFRAGEVLVLDMTKPPLSDLPNPYGITTTLIAPMRAGERLIGMLSLDYGGPFHPFTQQEMALAGAVAQFGAVILERERLLREREEARADALALRKANERMDEFMGIASHELRTPLTSITANVQMAERGLRHHAADASALPEGLGAALQRAHRLLVRTDRNVGRLDRLVGDLLDVSRIQSGELELREEPSDLIEIVRDAVMGQRAAWPDRTIALDLGKRHRLPIYADADRIGQVVTNYLTNALKYSASDQPVAVRIRTHDGRARIEVSDHGPGLAPEQQRHIWERFHRVPGIELRSGSGVGLGLGLYICQTIIARHGGQVGVESVVGQGSTFWFTLPLRESADREMPPATNASSDEREL